MKRPDGLNDRAWNNWKPLFAVAAAAGADWPARAVVAALAISGDEDGSEEEDVGTLALQHVWEVLEPAKRLATGDILRHLVSKDEGPWAKWWESHLAKDELKSPAARLAKLLRPFGIKPEQLWIEGQKTRGYDAEAFRKDTVSVYLEKEGRDGKDGRDRSNAQAGSTVSTDATDFSEGASATPSSNGRPLIGDDGYPAHLADALRRGLVTDLEVEQALAAHDLVRGEAVA